MSAALVIPLDLCATHDLYKLVELLEDYFGGSEEKLAVALNVPKALFKDGIKRLANQPPLNFRHAKSGETPGESRDLALSIASHELDTEPIVTWLVQRSKAI